MSEKKYCECEYSKAFSWGVANCFNCTLEWNPEREFMIDPLRDIKIFPLMEYKPKNEKE